MNALKQAIERIAEGTPLRKEAEAELQRLQRIEQAAKKLIALRGVAHGTWVVEELEAALGDA